MQKAQGQFGGIMSKQIPDISQMNKYCVVCEKEFGPHLQSHCTDKSLIAVTRIGYRKKIVYYSLDGKELSDSDLAALKDTEISRKETWKATSSTSKQPTPTRVPLDVSSDNNWSLMGSIIAPMVRFLKGSVTKSINRIPATSSHFDALDLDLRNCEVLNVSSPTSPWIILKNKNGPTIITDRETYRYSLGEVQGTTPQQNDLDQLFGLVTRVRVFSSGLYQNRALVPEIVIDTTDTHAIATLKNHLCIEKNPPKPERCACLGGPVIELSSDKEILAVIGLQHGTAIRWNQWRHDALLQDGKELGAWFAENGLEPDLLELLYTNQHNNNMIAVTRLPYTDRPISRSEQRLRIAENLQRKNNLGGAIAECQKALAMTPDSPFAYMIRGDIYLQQGRSSDCVKDYTKVIDSGLRTAPIYWTRGLAYDQLGQSAPALADFNAAVIADPNYANAYNSRGIIYLKMQKFDAALADLEKTLELKPEWFVPLINRSSIYLQTNNFDAVISDCNRAIEMIEKANMRTNQEYLAGVFWNRGKAYSAKGDHARAKNDIKKARSLNPAFAAQEF
jgi:tetratricopeptide (TPR) repeat protein